MRALFLTWDGPQQSYLESLFLPIFSGLRAHGVQVHVLQFSWATPTELAPTRAAAARFGVPYLNQRTSRRFGLAGNVAAVARGAAFAARFARSIDADVLFPRSLLPASMALLGRRLAPNLGLVFDADGLMADERVDFGGWSARGAPYRLLRAVEAECVRSAASVITRTHAAKRILLERAAKATEAKIFVVPNARDPATIGPGTEATRAEARRLHGVAKDVPWLVYVGSLGPQYQAERMFQLFGAVLRRAPGACFQLFTFHDAQAREALTHSGLPAQNVKISRASPEQIADALGAADVGLALRRESFSQRAVCPIKVAEYLLAGVPVVSTRVGDLAQQLGDEDVGRLLDDTSDSALEATASWLVTRVLPERAAFRARAREVGERLFGLPGCVAAYADAFALAARESSAR